jgi:hypothetical protein
MFEMSNEEKELDEIFHGENKPLHPETIHKTIVGAEKPATRTVPKKQIEPSKNAGEEKKPADAQWEPVRPEPNQMDKLKECAKFTVGFGGLSFLLFYWEQAGLMASSIAVPCMCVCTALAGWGVGKNAVGGKR